jgi:hypothetical protein
MRDAPTVADAVGARATQVRNEDEGRVRLTVNVLVCRFSSLTKDDREDFIEELKAVAR